MLILLSDEYNKLLDLISSFGISIPNSHIIASFAHTHILFSFVPSPSLQPIIVQLNNVFKDLMLLGTKMI